MAGVDCLKGFLKRHSHLSIFKLEGAARAMVFNRVTSGNFYQLPGEINDSLQSTPSCPIYHFSSYTVL